MDQELMERIDTFLEANRGALVEDLFALARIPSVRAGALDGKPFGEECARVLDCAIAMCEREGLKTKNDQYYCGSAKYGESEHEIGFVAHLDIVPAGDRDGWDTEPFEPVLKNDTAYGRGVRDNKSGMVSGLYAIKCIKDLGIPLKHSLRLIMGCAEETSMEDIPYFLAHNKAPDFCLVPDTLFPVCHGEKGIYGGDFLMDAGEDFIEFKGGFATNVVPDKAHAIVKGSFDLAALQAKAPKNIQLSAHQDGLLVKASGTTAHAALPEQSVNAIRVLADYIATNGLVSGKSLEAVRFISEMLSDNYGEHFGVAFEDEPSGKLTCIGGMVDLEGGKIKLNINIRYSVTHRGELITEGLQRCAKEHGVEYVFDSDSKPNYIPKDHPAVVQLTKVYAEVTGTELPPYVMGGGTYARHLPNAVAFGPDDPEEKLPLGQGNCHEPNECQSIDGLLKAVKIYICALLELDKTL